MSKDHSGIELDSLLENDEFLERLAGKVADRLAARQTCKASTIKEAVEGFRQIAQDNGRLKFLGD